MPPTKPFGRTLVPCEVVNNNTQKRTDWLLLVAFAAAKMIAQYVLIDASFDLHRDEFLHLDQGYHPDWGYLTVPPLTAWTATVVAWFGGSVFWVKFFPALYGTITLWLVWRTVEALGGGRFARVLAASCVLLSVLLRLNMLFQPNSFDVMAWTAFYYCVIRYVQQPKLSWLVAGAVVFAAGFLNKYNVVFLVAGLLPALLLSPHCRMLVSRGFLFALLAGLVLITPNVWWQFRHGFPVIWHMGALASTQLVHVDRVDFLRNQLLFFSGGLPVLLAGLVALWIYPPYRPFRFFIWSLVITLTVFALLRAKDYYAIGLYPVYLAFGAVFLEETLKHGWRVYLRPVLLVIPLLVFIPLYRVAFPNHPPQFMMAHADRYQRLGMLRWEDGIDHHLPQDFADMLGWKQLADVVDSVCNTLPDPAHTILLCDNYGQTGAVNFYRRQAAPVAYSFHADYVDWMTWEDPIRDVVLVKENDDEDKERLTERPLFDTVYLAARRVNPLAREDTISVFVLRGAKVDVSPRIREEAEETRMRHR
ncbi:MAG: glycosyltransferase family 39 protein [Cyclobacteriaceae bacterium]|nr:glycosyltransferase family 39 protein [Cyclobacteriaceae bacterium]